MAAQGPDTATPAQKTIPRLHKPSPFWCAWQAFNGANSRKVKVPVADLRDKWVILTGGNSGIGKEAALQFARWGANVVLGCRQPPPHETPPDTAVEECKAAALAAGHENTIFEWWMCDMGDLASVEAFGKRWLEKGRPLDILANNAGMGGGLGTAQVTRDGFDIIHQVNFLAHVLLTMTLLPALVRAQQPRIICTTSCFHYLGTFNLDNVNSSMNAYPNNKLYFQTWLTELQDRLSKHANYAHVTVLGVHPGYVKTNIWKTSGGNSTFLRDGGLGALVVCFGIDSQQGSLAITYAATGNSDGKAGGRYINRIWGQEAMPQTMHPDCRDKIWEYVNKVLKLDEKGLLKDFNT